MSRVRSFNPRTPCGVRPALADLDMINMWVSIHALLAECDIKRDRLAIVHDSFNPRTPCGVRHSFGIFWHCSMWFQSTHSLRSATIMRKQADMPILFQSTHSLRSATFPFGIENVQQVVSIHALLAECDLVSFGIVNVPHGFNPRTPCGVRPVSLKAHLRK